MPISYLFTCIAYFHSTPFDKLLGSKNCQLVLLGNHPEELELFSWLHLTWNNGFQSANNAFNQWHYQSSKLRLLSNWANPPLAIKENNSLTSEYTLQTSNLMGPFKNFNHLTCSMIVGEEDFLVIYIFYSRSLYVNK